MIRFMKKVLLLIKRHFVKQKSINFDSSLVMKIVNKEKTSTIRKNLSVKPGDIVTLKSDGKPFAIAVISEVKPITLKEIDDNIARLDGFNSKEELREKLYEIYGDIDENTTLYLIKFKLIKNLL